MRALFLFILILFANRESYSQNFLQFEEDKPFKEYFSEYIQKLDIPQANNMLSDFELRIWIQASILENYTLVRITKRRTKWHLYTYELMFDSEEKPYFIKTNKSLLGFDTTFSDLVSHNLLTLPNYKQVLINKTLQSDAYPLDGVNYCFQVLTKQKKRSYTYHSPKLYSEQFPNVTEFQDLNYNLELLTKVSGIDLMKYE